MDGGGDGGGGDGGGGGEGGVGGELRRVGRVGRVVYKHDWMGGRLVFGDWTWLLLRQDGMMILVI